MPAEVGYGAPVNLAANIQRPANELIRPPSVTDQVADSVDESESPTQERINADRQERETTAAANAGDDTGSTTPERGQSLDILA